MKILVIGNGGREHALAWKLAQSTRLTKVYVAPGNAGTALEPDITNVAITTIPELVEFAQREKIAFTVVGPEAPLAAGVVDAFRTEGLKIFGPTKAAAQLESSKDYAKAFMVQHHIPTAAYSTFTNAAHAHAYIDIQGAPIVIKADGLAAGKGVVVAQSVEEAHAAVSKMFDGEPFDRAGVRVVIEECLVGEEASFIVMSDGHHVLPLATSQDHKRLKDGDLGPNTGGMGACSPAQVITPELHARVMREIILPTIEGMAREGEPFTGFLYAGLMIDAQGNPKTLEFNCRMGDPETQPIMLRLKSDLITLFEHAINGTLDKCDVEWDRRAALGVVMAAAGYPDSPRKGDIIHGLPSLNSLMEETPRDFHIFHAGTNMRGNDVITSGGRVLCVTALGDKMLLAQRRAYEVAENVKFDGCQMRRDIGHRAIGIKSRGS